MPKKIHSFLSQFEWRNDFYPLFECICPIFRFVVVVVSVVVVVIVVVIVV